MTLCELMDFFSGGSECWKFSQTLTRFSSSDLRGGAIKLINYSVFGYMTGFTSSTPFASFETVLHLFYRIRTFLELLEAGGWQGFLVALDGECRLRSSVCPKDKYRLCSIFRSARIPARGESEELNL